jgi:hypothetical protein
MIEHLNGKKILPDHRIITINKELTDLSNTTLSLEHLYIMRKDLQLKLSTFVKPKTQIQEMLENWFHPLSLSDNTNPKLLVDKIHEHNKLWRSFFLESMKPKFMPDGWSIDYQKYDILEKIEKINQLS